MAKVENSFKAGSLVFAKLRGFPYWPARVESKVEGTYYVYFFGTHETTALNISNLLPFNDENKKKYGKIKRKYFAEAMDTIQRDPDFKAECVFNIPGTTVKKAVPVKPVTPRKKKILETVPAPPPKAPRDPPKRRSPVPENDAANKKREKVEVKLPPVVPQKPAENIQERAPPPLENVPVVEKSPKIEETNNLPKKPVPTPIVYDYLNTEKSPAEMGRLPLMKRKEPQREQPPVVPVAEQSTVEPPKSREQESFSSPIKKRKLSPPKKAPERYLEAASQRRNSAQRKELLSDSSKSEETTSVVSDSTSESSKAPKAAKITQRSSGSQPGNKRASNHVEYQPRQMIFAKVKGYPFWPARVDAVVPGTKPAKYQIFFYGTHEHAKLMAKDLLPVTAETREKHGKPNKRSNFNEGIAEMQANPWIEFPGGSSVTSTPVPVTSSVSAPSIIPPVTLVPQLNVQQTSPHSPQGSSQKTGSDKDDSESLSDSSDST